MTEYAHLDPALRSLADLSQRERIERIRADRWVDYPRAREALDRLEELFLFPQRCARPSSERLSPSKSRARDPGSGRKILRAGPCPRVQECRWAMKVCL